MTLLESIATSPSRTEDKDLTAEQLETVAQLRVDLASKLGHKCEECLIDAHVARLLELVGDYSTRTTIDEARAEVAAETVAAAVLGHQEVVSASAITHQVEVLSEIEALSLSLDWEELTETVSVAKRELTRVFELGLATGSEPAVSTSIEAQIDSERSASPMRRIFAEITRDIEVEEAGLEVERLELTDDEVEREIDGLEKDFEIESDEPFLTLPSDAAEFDESDRYPGLELPPELQNEDPDFERHSTEPEFERAAIDSVLTLVALDSGHGHKAVQVEMPAIDEEIAESYAAVLQAPIAKLIGGGATGQVASEDVRRLGLLAKEAQRQRLVTLALTPDEKTLLETSAPGLIAVDKGVDARTPALRKALVTKAKRKALWVMSPEEDADEKRKKLKNASIHVTATEAVAEQSGCKGCAGNRGCCGTSDLSVTTSRYETLQSQRRPERNFNDLFDEAPTTTEPGMPFERPGPSMPNFEAMNFS